MTKEEQHIQVGIMNFNPSCPCAKCGEERARIFEKHIGSPTPPTPAGAGTETPRTDAFLNNCHCPTGKNVVEKFTKKDLAEFARQLERELRANSDEPKKTAAAMYDIINAFLRWQLPESVSSDTCCTRPGEGRVGTNLLTCPETMAMVVDVVQPVFERELTSLRRQAEADRATIAELKDVESMYVRVVKEVLECNPVPARSRADNRLEPPWEVIARIRAQLASADKDRERLAEARNGLRATQDLLWNNPTESACAAYEIADRLLKGTVQHVSAALQPSASLDHGARGKKP